MSPNLRIILLLLLLPLIGTGAFIYLEEMEPLDALYMAVITLTTVGFHEVEPLGPSGKVFVIVYLVIGLGVFYYSVSTIGEFVVRGELRRTLGRNRMDSTIRALEGHQIICGYGRMGANLAEHLAAEDQRYVVVDNDADALEHAAERGFLAVEGDATDDDVLRAAGVMRAGSLVAVLSSDSENLHLVLSARLLNPKLRILARATSDKSMAKLSQAGADEVINLYRLGATRMAELLVPSEGHDEKR